MRLNHLVASPPLANPTTKAEDRSRVISRTSHRLPIFPRYYVQDACLCAGRRKKVYHLQVEAQQDWETNVTRRAAPQAGCALYGKTCSLVTSFAMWEDRGYPSSMTSRKGWLDVWRCMRGRDSCTRQGYYCRMLERLAASEERRCDSKHERQCRAGDYFGREEHEQEGQMMAGKK